MPPHLKSEANPSGTVRTKYKVALREMAQEMLPASILDKPKHGFSLPLCNWVREKWAGVSASSVMSFLPDQRWLCWDGVEREWRRHMEARTDCSTFLFMLLALDLWCRCNATCETQLC
mgnify:FL=1